jgi:hypothetical protein
VPEFNPSVLAYSLKINGAAAQIQIVPTAADAKAAVQVNGVHVASGTASDPIELIPDVNRVAVEVTSEQGTTQTYDLMVELDVPPVAAVTYSSEGPTNEDVIATITPSEPVTITNNKGLASYTFTDNGSFTFEFIDANGNQGTAVAVVDWIDKVSPSLEVKVDKMNLWPANHKMIPIQVTLESDGTGSEIESIVLTSITSNEEDNGTGDGNTTNDIQDAEFGTYDTSFSLRAERSGKGSGRIYTITYTITDIAGNMAASSAQVVVGAK